MSSVDDREENSHMARVLIHVEGETEETFVNEILRPHLCNQGYSNVSARLLGNARQRDKRGGIRAWNSVRKDILNHLKEDPACLATTIVDYYALPKTGAKAWPGREAAVELSFDRRATMVEESLLKDICQELGEGFDPFRFIPFVIIHEFEGLLFSDCKGFGLGIGRPELVAKFQSIRDMFASPEHINDSPITAPSKRIEELVPGYQKPLMGMWAMQKIGLGTIRRECPHFREWLERLEAWPAVSS